MKYIKKFDSNLPPIPNSRNPFWNYLTGDKFIVFRHNDFIYYGKLIQFWIFAKVQLYGIDGQFLRVEHFKTEDMEIIMATKDIKEAIKCYEESMELLRSVKNYNL